MEYMTCIEAHELWGITTRRIQQMCKNGDIEGAKNKASRGLFRAMPYVLLTFTKPHLF